MALRENKEGSIKRGFTLVELLVVIAIIAVLLSILMPSLQKARRQAQGVVCMNNVRQIGFGVQLYKGDNKELYCFSTGVAASLMNFHSYDEYYNNVTFWKFVGPYVKDPKANKCPANPANILGRQLTSSAGKPVDMVFGYSYNVEFGYLEPDVNKPLPAPVQGSNPPYYCPIRDGDVKNPSTKILVSDSAMSYYQNKYCYFSSDLVSMEMAYRLYPAATEDLMKINYGFLQAVAHGSISNVYADGSAGRQDIKSEMKPAQWFPVPSRMPPTGLANFWGIKTRRPNSAPKLTW